MDNDLDDKLFKKIEKARPEHLVAHQLISVLLENNCEQYVYRFFGDDKNNTIILTVLNLVNYSFVKLTVKYKEKKVIIEHFGRNEPRAFNIGKENSIINTYYLFYQNDPEYREIINKVLFCLNQDTDFSLWVKQGNNPRIKATNCNISDLHETDVIAFEIEDIEELKDDVISLSDKTKLHLDPLYQKYKHLNKASYFVVYNLRRELFLFTKDQFNKHFYF
jgi:hypothetical protein